MISAELRSVLERAAMLLQREQETLGVQDTKHSNEAREKEAAILFLCERAADVVDELLRESDDVDSTE